MRINVLKAWSVAVALFTCGAVWAGEAKPLLPTEETPQQHDARMQWWREARFGMFIHWGPASVSGKEISWARMGHPHDHPGNESVPADVYDRLYQQFNPVKFDADAWMQLAKDAGMRYVVFITKHHDGFSMWPTQLRADYSIAATPFQRDLCKEIADAAHRHGLKLGWYYSTRDWTHPDYLVGDNRKYDDFYQGQVRELLSNYGRVDMLWFDHVAGNWRDYQFQKLFEMLYGLQPGILVNDRAARFIRGTEDSPSPELARLTRGDFDTPEQRIGQFQRDRDWESCMTITACSDGGGWSYRPDGRTRSFEECLQMLASSACGDGNLLLNVGPLPTGEIAADQQAVLRQMGQWLAQYGESIYGTRGGPFRNGAWGGATYRGQTVYLHVFRRHGPVVHLPRLKANVVCATALTGGTPHVDSDASGVDVLLPPESMDAADAVIKLELDTAAEAEFVDGQPLAVMVPGALALSSPCDYQVFQRQTKARGTVVISGQVPEGCDKLEVRVEGQWQPVNAAADQKTFRAEVTVPAGGWYVCQARAWKDSTLLAAGAVPHVGVGEVFVVAGQSNSCSFGSERQTTASGRVAAFDGSRWQLANDPQPGAEGPGGSFMPAFGDVLQEKLGVPIGVVAVGAGGTSVRQWLPKGDRMEQKPTTDACVRAVENGQWESTGELFDRLASRLTALGPHGCRAVLWHQGESDAGQARGNSQYADRQISGVQYQAFLTRLIQASREAAGWDVPWFVAQATYHSEQDPADDEFRAAQAAVCQDGLAFQGPDTDALRAEYRDGVHFNGRGLRRHGELWAEKVGGWLAGQREGNVWNRFRGPNGTGVSDAKTVPAQWTENDYNWKIELPGAGHSSPVVWENRIFVTCADPTTALRTVVCIDAATGNALWKHEEPSKTYDQHKDNGYATATPTVDADGVIITWTTPDAVMLLALDLEGKEVWRRDLGPLISLQGSGSSPIFYRDMVVLVNDQEDMAVGAGRKPDGPNPAGRSFVVAVDRKIGVTRWETEIKTSMAGYTTPCIYQAEGSPDQLVFANTAQGIVSLDPATGKFNWEFGQPFLDRAVISPLLAPGLVLAGHGAGIRGSRCIAVRPGAAAATLAYELTSGIPMVPTGLVKDGRLFLWCDDGVVSCLRVETGEKVWRERVNGNFFASPVWVDGRLYNVSKKGEVVVIAAEDKFEVLHRISLGESSYATPAVSGGVMYLRTSNHLFSLGGSR